MALSVPVIVQTNGGAGRIGTAVYDNASAGNNTKSVIVIYDDSTYTEEARATLVTGASGFYTGTGI